MDFSPVEIHEGFIVVTFQLMHSRQRVCVYTLIVLNAPVLLSKSNSHSRRRFMDRHEVIWNYRRQAPIHNYENERILVCCHSFVAF